MTVPMSAESSNSIEIQHYRVFTHIGCTDEERNHAQELAFDVEVKFDPTKACISDELCDTVDYMALRQIIDEVCKTKAAKLLEHLGWTISKRMMLEFSSIQSVQLKIKKFSTMREAQYVAFNFLLNRRDL